ncbi:MULTISPECIES: flagellar hook-length control protein FliK [Desulfurella]|uniref:flagellar hook-length control protein FliK n=1 Tax=Desulfurella TaxID=33001 RepID=UPI000CA6EB52|nr:MULTISPECIES: flagellar hook-length control protein FliK [Desulfurella]PMP67839.1 MAG: hypothetical protein C0192_02905 [Desulfurella multipotens]PMP69135.1 MAG: hypothetical protein C0192_00640 [Desulfurella multipotens]PMP93128.1 MAG: hypothetical protein C0173_01185 [Desulfurella sp.]HEX14251.1 flagellar hook-length control protein FliK [Desulfurella acetivorans]
MQKAILDTKLNDIIFQIIDKLATKSTSKDLKSDFSSILQELLKTDYEDQTNTSKEDILNTIEELIDNPKNTKKNIDLSKNDIIALLSLIQNSLNNNFKNIDIKNTNPTNSNYSLQKLNQSTIDTAYTIQTAQENSSQKNSKANENPKSSSQLEKIVIQTKIAEKLDTSNSNMKDTKFFNDESNKTLQTKIHQTSADQKENPSLEQIFITQKNYVNKNPTKENTHKSADTKIDIETKNNYTNEDPSLMLKMSKDKQNISYNQLPDKSKLNSDTKTNQNPVQKNILETTTQLKPDNHSAQQSLEITENKLLSPKDQPKINYLNNTNNIQIKDDVNSASQNKPSYKNPQNQQNQTQEQPQTKFTIDNKILKTLFTIQNQPNINQELESLQKPLIEEKTLNQIKQEPIINNQSSFGLSNALSLQKMQDTPNIPKQAYPINHIIEKIIELQNLRPPVIKTIQIQLNPPSLGHIDVKVSIDSSKNLSASIHVDNQEVFNLVNSNLDTLKTTILQQGINVSQISVTSSNLSQQNFNQNQNQQNQTFSSFNQNFNQSDNSQNSFNQAFSQQKQQNYVFENNTKQIKRIFRKTIALLDISI